jgi:DNA-binding protein
MENTQVAPAGNDSFEHTFHALGYKRVGDDSGIVLVGKESIGAYITVAETYLKEGRKITVLSRGRYNSLSIDICNLLKNKGYATIEKIETRTVVNPVDQKRVSVLEIYLNPTGGKK